METAGAWSSAVVLSKVLSCPHTWHPRRTAGHDVRCSCALSSFLKSSCLLKADIFLVSGSVSSCSEPISLLQFVTLVEFFVAWEPVHDCSGNLITGDGWSEGGRTVFLTYQGVIRSQGPRWLSCASNVAVCLCCRCTRPCTPLSVCQELPYLWMSISQYSRLI